MVWFLVRYLNNHLMNLFAGAWESRDVSPLPLDIPQATDDQVRPLLILKFTCHLHVFCWSMTFLIQSVRWLQDWFKCFAAFFFSLVNVNQVQRCIELVSRAKKPVILLGSQATLPPTPVDDIRYRTMCYVLLLDYTVLRHSFRHFHCLQLI